MTQFFLEYDLPARGFRSGSRNVLTFQIVRRQTYFGDPA